MKIKGYTPLVWLAAAGVASELLAGVVFLSAVYLCGPLVSDDAEYNGPALVMLLTCYCFAMLGVVLLVAAFLAFVIMIGVRASRS